MTRWKAAGLHLTISAVVGVCAFCVLYFIWYPPPYFLAAGGGRLATIVLGVDVVVGPLLTLLVYRAGKHGLRFDLSFIVLLQLGALAYGLHVMWSSRPVYLVAAVDRFTLVTADNTVRRRWLKHRRSTPTCRAADRDWSARCFQALLSSAKS